MSSTTKPRKSILEERCTVKNDYLRKRKKKREKQHSQIVEDYLDICYIIQSGAAYGTPAHQKPLMGKPAATSSCAKTERRLLYVADITISGNISSVT